jgi:uncharacterized repeat protein (TIGR01451 family)
VSSTGPNASIGNFLDSISFGTQPCLVTTTTVSPPPGRTTGTAQVGDVLTYTVTTANNGGNPAREVVMSDDLPAGVEFVPGSIRAVTSTTTAVRSDAVGDDAGEYDTSTGTGQGTVRVRVGRNAGTTAGGVVDPGDVRTFSYQARVLPALSGQTLRDDAKVTYRDDLSASTLTSTSDEAATAIGVAADLRATLTQGTTPLVAGRPATWTATLTNRGPGTEPAPQLTTTVPAGLTGVTATPVGGGSCTVSGTTVTCTGPALAPGAARGVTIAGGVPADAVPGAQDTLLSSVRGDSYDQGPTDNTATVSGAVTALADLSVRLASDPAVGVAGDPVTYTARVRNDGPSTARGVRLVDPLQPGSTLQSATVAGGTCTLAAGSNTVSCALPDLAPGTELPVLVTVQLAPDNDGRIDNAVSVAATTPDPDADDLTASVSGAGSRDVDLRPRLTLDRTDLMPGQTLAFTVVVDNLGASDATNVSVRSTLPPGVRIVGTDSTGCVPGNCSIPVVPHRGSVTINGTAVVDPDAPEGTAFASATVVSAVPDADEGNQSATVSATIRLSADLAVTLALSNPTDPGAPLVAGQDVAGLATVTNNGPTRASGVQLRLAALADQPVPVVTTRPRSDGSTPPRPLDAGACAYQGGVRDGLAVDGGVVVCWLDQLEAGGTWLIDSRGRVPATFTDTSFSRSRTVTSTSADPVATNDTGTASVRVERRADLQVAMTTSTPSVVQTGAVQFQVRVTNAGPSDARDVVVREEPQPGVVITGAHPSAGSYGDAVGVWRIPYLAVGASALLDVSGTAESPTDVENRATATGSDATDPDPRNTGSARVTVLPAQRTLTTTAQVAVSPAVDGSGLRVGDAVDLAYVVRNDGNVRISGIRVDETLVPGAVACPHDALAPGEQMSCTAGSTYRVTQADVDAGTPVTSRAVTSGRAPDSTTDLTFAPAATSVPVTAGAPALRLTLVADWDDADGDDALDEGETVTWTAVVVNTGDLTTGALAVSAPGTPSFTCTDTVLAPGAWTSCATATTLAAADVGGQRRTTAVATGTEARAGTVVRSAPSETLLPAEATPALRTTLGGVVAPSAHQDAAAPGDQVTWRYTVTNTGNVELTGVAVDDADGGAATCAATLLQPGQTTVCTSDVPRVVAEADVLVGGITERATATGTPAGGAPVRSPQDQTVLRVAGAVRSLQVSVVASTPGPVSAGETIRYAYDVRNDGNVTMRLVSVADELVGPASCALQVLAPGASTSCTSGGSHRVTQQEFDAGQPIADLAQVSGIPAGSATPLTFGPASAPVAVAAARPELAVRGVADWTDDGDRAVEAGETIDWWALVSNPGDVTLTRVEVTSSRGDVLTCPVPVLGPGEQMRCTAPRYTITAADAGVPAISALFTVGGDEPRAGTRVTGTDTRAVSTTEELGLLLTVGQAVAGSPVPDLGDRVRGLFTVTNVGNVAVQDVGVTSVDLVPVTCPAGPLTPGASTVCRTSTVHEVSEADLRNGTLTVAGTATATAVASGARTTSALATQALSLAPLVRALEVTAAAVPSATGPLRVGDGVTYTYVVRNLGNATMDGVALTDAAGGAANCPTTTLAPGAVTTCTGTSTYVVDQDDFDAGLPVGLTAQVAGLPDGLGTPLTFGPATAPLPVAAAGSALTATKTAVWADDGDGLLDAGETVDWTVRVRNTGELTVRDLTVDDALVHVQCPQDSVAPGAEVDCASDHDRVTAADVLAGGRTNTAVAQGDDPRTGAPVVSNAAVAAVPPPALAIAVDGVVSPAERQGAAETGDTVRWRYTVTNNGGVPVDSLGVEDLGDGPVACPPAQLAPGQALTCDGVVPHPVTEDDVLSRSVRTTATAVGVSLDPVVVPAGSASLAAAAPGLRSAPADGAVPTAAVRTGLDLTQRLENTTSRDRDARPQRDDLVRVVYRVANTGNLTLTGVTVADPAFGTVGCPQTSLAPGGSMECSTDTPHQVDGADVVAGRLVSDAQATGAPPSGAGTVTVSDTSAMDVPLAAADGGPPPPGTPVDGTPVDGTPVDGTPVDGSPVDGSPVGGTPVDGTPVDGSPVDGTPVDGTPVDGSPVGGVPVDGAPVGGVPVGGAPVDGAPADGALVDGLPADPADPADPATRPAPAPRPTPAGLAATGEETGPPLALGALALSLGAFLMVLGRRRVVGRRW